MDVAIFNWINHWPHFSWLDPVMIRLDFLVNRTKLFWPLVCLFLLGLIFKKRKLWQGALFLLLALLLGGYLVNFLKSYFHRPRPYKTLQNVYVLGKASGNCFPALLAASTSLISLFIILMTNRWKLFWLGMILFFGIFRIYCGVHYPTDILAGWAIGALIGWIFYLGYKLCDQTTDKLTTAFKNRKTGSINGRNS